MRCYVRGGSDSFYFGILFHLGAPLWGTTSSCLWQWHCLWQMFWLRADKKIQISIFFFFFFPPHKWLALPGMFWQGGHNFKLNVNVEAFQSSKLQRFLSMAQGEIKLSMLTGCCDGRGQLWYQSLSFCLGTNLDTREALSCFHFTPLTALSLLETSERRTGHSWIFPSTSRRWLVA